MKFLALLFLLTLSTEAYAEEPLVDIATSAALDNPEALYNLGVEFYTGHRIPKDLSKSAKLWQKAGNLGVVSAKNNLGFLLFNGYGITKDQAKAVTLWRDAAANGHDEAQWHLGMALFDGTGTNVDRIQGAAWALCAYKSAVSLRHEEIVKLASRTNDEQLRELTLAERQKAVTLAEMLFAKYSARWL